MDNNLLQAVQITVIGMGLVFVSLILLWWMMALLVRLTQDRIPKMAGKTTDEIPETTGSISSELRPEEQNRRKRAALVAVALALAEHDQQTREFPIPNTAIVSAWQAVNRANILNKRGNVR
jgi:sodium pump decarboxylase gamma subunit